MDNKEYVQRHELLAEKSDRDGNKIVDSLKPYLLLILNKAKDIDNKNIIEIIEKIESTIVNMYISKLDNELKTYLNKLVKDVHEFESRDFEYKLDSGELSKAKEEILNNSLVIKTSLVSWLLMMAYKDTFKVSRIIRSNINKPESISKQIVNYNKRPINNIRRIVDAMIYGATFKIRDLLFTKNEIELIRWVSILDGRTSPMCAMRAGKIYYMNSKLPYNHSIGWEEPGVYHWGCRSFVVPYYE